MYNKLLQIVIINVVYIYYYSHFIVSKIEKLNVKLNDTKSCELKYACTGYSLLNINQCILVTVYVYYSINGCEV